MFDVFLKRTVVCLTVLILAWSSDSDAQEEVNPFVFSGVVLEQGHNPLITRFTAWLSQHANYSLQTRFTQSYQDLSDTLQSNPYALAWTCGSPFVQDHLNDQQQLLAVPLFKGKPTYHSFVMTTIGRSEKSLKDFKGQVFAYSDPRSNSGFVAPAYALKQQGIDIKEHFRFLMHTGLHEHAIEALLSGQADVANIDEYVVEAYWKANPESKKKLVILESFGPYPFTPIVAAKSVSKADVYALQQALLGMHQDVEGAKILKAFGMDGFVLKPFSFYQPIADMLDALKH